MSLEYLPQDTRITFELQGSLPILRERYVSPQAGTTVLLGIFNQTAQIETLNGTSFRLLPPKKEKELFNMMAYPVVELPYKAEVFRLRTPIKLEKEPSPRLRFTTSLDECEYVFRPMGTSRRGFELWDGMEMQKLATRERGQSLISDVTLLASVPAVLALLFPWLDSQSIMYRQS